MSEKEKRLTASKARENFSDILSRAAFSGEHFLVHRYGQDLIRIIPARIPIALTEKTGEEKKRLSKS